MKISVQAGRPVLRTDEMIAQNQHFNTQSATENREFQTKNVWAKWVPRMNYSIRCGLGTVLSNNSYG
jgi:hypothetical protein